MIWHIAKKKLKENIFYFLPLLSILPLASQASIIESSLGTAVVNDATASFYNPAALVLLKNPQIVTLGTASYFHSRFTGSSTRVLNNATEDGSSSSNTHYYSPSIYLGIPTVNGLTLGLAMVSNFAERNGEETSILRYVQANNNIQDYDLVPGFALKMNDQFSIGAGINFSYAEFDMRPITGFPGSSTSDSESRNDCNGSGVGGNAGFLFRPGPATLIGFNYRTSTTYRLSGTSVFNGSTQVISNDYHFKLRTPARSVLSVNHFITPTVGFIATVQRLQWSIIRNINIDGIATLSGSQPIIVNASVPYHLRDTWLFTLGNHYRITPKCIIRVAGTYNQSPGNSDYQIINGDSIVLGATVGYELNKTVTVDGGYAHAFIQNADIHTKTGRFLVNGVNEGSRDAVSLKLTFNV